ncbi:MAG: DctP family TRAP transporter solute-binding subunit [Tropicimonas sp.]|uniref:DctP family TRAP transporter solute-binding subunit n=1 Tax=Tropicimonas sp. TaxID=2067044 RepID=UPI003A84354B
MLNRKSLVASLVAGLMLPASLFAADVEYPKLSLKMSTTVGEQSNAAQMAQAYADAVKEASDGRIKIRVFPSDQLSGGNMSKGVEMIRSGAIDLAYEPVDVMAVLDQRLLALSIPWAFDNYQAAEDSLLGEGGDFIKAALREQGIEALGFIHNGFRQLTNSKREIRTPADLKAMKLRVPGGDVFVNFFRVFGADPVAMSFSELFTALQQGTVDGQENGFDLITANKFYEVQPYITAWNYSYGSFALVFNKKTWDGFDENTQALLQEKAMEINAMGNQRVVEGEAEKREFLTEYGVKITDLTPEELQAFKDMLGEYYTGVKATYGEEATSALGIK